MSDIVKVLVVDDSYFMRKIIIDILETDPQLKVVGTAGNGIDALEKIKSLRPDVVTLDIDMPDMDGLTAVRHIMIQCPVPVVVFSSLFCYGDITFESMMLGVIDFVPKPSGVVSKDKNYLRKKIIDRVKNASGVNIGNVRRASKYPKSKGIAKTLYTSLDNIITVGAGLSGTSSVIRLVSKLEPTLPAAIIAMLEVTPQILPSFVERFNEHVAWNVALVEDGQEIKPGVCYIGSNENAVRVGLNDDNLPCFRLEGDMPDPLNVLFESACNIFDRNTIGVMLDGLGDDGAVGFSQIQTCHGVTLVPNTNCCVFPNLSQNAINRGTVSQVVDEAFLPRTINNSIMFRERVRVA